MHWEITPKGCMTPDAFPAGLLYGYGVYTSFRWPIDSHWLEFHRQRLWGNAQVLGLLWHWDWHHVMARVESLVTPEQPVVRLSIVADVQTYGDLYARKRLPSRLFLSLRSLPAAGEPVRLQTVTHRRPLPLVKQVGMADVIQLKRQARQAGFDDVLLLNEAGHLTESSTSNVFLIQGDRLFTPVPDRDGCLAGIARMRLLEEAKRLGVTTDLARPVAKSELKRADGVFLTNAISMSPVQSVDGQALPWPDSAKNMLGQLTAAMG